MLSRMGWGWGGWVVDAVPRMGCGWGRWVVMLMFLATPRMGWGWSGGVLMLTFLALAHMVDATHGVKQTGRQVHKMSFLACCEKGCFVTTVSRPAGSFCATITPQFMPRTDLGKACFFSLAPE